MQSDKQGILLPKSRQPFLGAGCLRHFSAHTRGADGRFHPRWAAGMNHILRAAEPVRKTPGLTLLLSATLCAASRAMALATEVETGTPCGCGRMRLGEGDRRPGPEPCRPGGSSRCPWAGVGARPCSQASSTTAWGPGCSSLVSGALALANGFGVGAVLGWGAGGTRRSGGMAATAESTDSPWAERVRTVTPLASRLRRRTSSTAVPSAVGEMISATCAQRKPARLGDCQRPRPPDASRASHEYPTQTALHSLQIRSVWSPRSRPDVGGLEGQLSTCFSPTSRTNLETDAGATEESEH